MLFFGELLERFGTEMTKTHVVLRNISDEFLHRVNEFVDRKDEESTRRIEREILEEMYDEDDLTDISLSVKMF